MSKIAIFHEGMPMEARWVAGELNREYGLEGVPIEKRLDGIFKKLPGSEAYEHSLGRLYRYFLKNGMLANAGTDGYKRVLVLTPRDIFDCRSEFKGDVMIPLLPRDDDWVIGRHVGGMSVVSTARLRKTSGHDSKSYDNDSLIYQERVVAAALHRVGHDVIDGRHFAHAVWIDAETGREADYGPHCDNDACVMYKVMGITSPPKEKGYLKFRKNGNDSEPRYGMGLDELIDNIVMGKKDWLCEKCKKSVIE